MKIVVLDGAALNPGDMSWAQLEQFGNLTVYERTPKELVSQRIADADIITTNKVNITKEIIDSCPHLKLICCLATGYNVVDTAHARSKGIPVCNVPSYSTAAVAQFTFALLLELCHHIGHHDRAVHAGKWASCPNFCFWDTPQIELAGMTMGIVGYGKIGKAVANIARAMGMNVIAYSRTHQDVTLNELLAQSDIVSLHCPLFPETQGLINAATIKIMKDGAILLNTARGAIIDEAAVAEALACGKLGGAAMDVVSEEPINPANPLLTAPNCIITPHMAWAPAKTRQRILDVTEESIRSWLEGKPVNVVNP